MVVDLDILSYNPNQGKLRAGYVLLVVLAQKRFGGSHQKRGWPNTKLCLSLEYNAFSEHFCAARCTACSSSEFCGTRCRKCFKMDLYTVAKQHLRSDYLHLSLSLS